MKKEIAIELLKSPSLREMRSVQTKARRGILDELNRIKCLEIDNKFKKHLESRQIYGDVYCIECRHLMYAPIERSVLICHFMHCSAAYFEWDEFDLKLQKQRRSYAKWKENKKAQNARYLAKNKIENPPEIAEFDAGEFKIDWLDTK